MKYIFSIVILLISYTTLFSQSIDQRQYQLAQSYEQRGDLEGASRIYLELAKNNAQIDEYMIAFVRTIKQLNKYDDFLDFIKERAKQNTSFLVLSYLGEAYWLKGFTEESNEAFKDAENNCIAEEDFLKVYESLLFLKQYSKAIEVLSKARLKLRNSQIYSDELSKLYVFLGDKKNAIKEIISNLKKTKNFGLAQGRLYALMLNPKANMEIDQILNEKYEENKRDTYVLNMYIWFARTAGYYEKALELTLDYDKLLTGSYSEILRFANQCKNDNQYDIAIKAFSLVIEQGRNNPNASSALYGLAWTLEQKNLSSDTSKPETLNEIISIYKKIIEDYPSTIYEMEGNYRLAMISKNNLKDNKSAINYLKKISTKWGILPVFINAQFELSDLYIKVGELDQAQKVLRNLIKSFTYNDSEVQKHTEIANFKIAKIYYYLGQIDSTKAVLDRIPQNASSEVMNDILEFYDFLNKNQNLNAALNAYSQAELLELQDRPDDAVSKFRESAKFSKGDDLEETSIIRIAQILNNKKEFVNSNKEYESILDNFPNSINLDLVHFRIGQNYYQMKLYDEAVQSFTKIILNFPKSIYYEDARKLIREIREIKNES